MCSLVIRVIALFFGPIFILEATGIVDTSFLKTSYNSFPWPQPTAKTQDLKVRLYLRGSSLDEPTEVCAGSCENITFRNISPQNPIKIVIHGWHGYEKCTFFQEILKAYFDNGDYNIITLDWSALGSRNLFYPHARNQVPFVASKVAIFLNSLKAELGIQLEDLHIIGHSLGAHIAGVAAYQIYSGKLGRITGLDPAGPMFSLEDYKGRLSTDSALFVDVIHSSYNFIGMGATIGHADFIPNGPHKLQRGCGIDIFGRCSHRRSFYWYVESIVRPQAFMAVPCLNWQYFKRNECEMDKVVPMGESTPKTTRGVFYLSTNKYSPFGKGAIN